MTTSRIEEEVGKRVAPAIEYIRYIKELEKRETKAQAEEIQRMISKIEGVQ